jgi:hypothetical protein
MGLQEHITNKIKHKLNENVINSDYKYIYKKIIQKYPDVVGNWNLIKSFVDDEISNIEITDTRDILNKFNEYRRKKFKGVVNKMLGRDINESTFVMDNRGRYLLIDPADVKDYKKGKSVWASDKDGEEYEINKKNSSIVSEIVETKQLDEKLITFSNRAPYGQVVFMAGGAGCFDGDTLVKTESGYSKITDIKVGDKIYTFNEVSKIMELDEVVECYNYKLSDLPENQKMLELEFDNGTKIKCTENHEFYINGSWVMAKNLELGVNLD